MTHVAHDHDAAAQSSGLYDGKHGDVGKSAAVDPAIDPVCGMSVDKETAKHRFVYKRQDYFFCGARCRQRFEAEPDKFLQLKEVRQPAAPAGTPPPAAALPASPTYTG